MQFNIVCGKLCFVICTIVSSLCICIIACEQSQTVEKQFNNSMAGWFFRNTYILGLLEGIRFSIFRSCIWSLFSYRSYHTFGRFSPHTLCGQMRNDVMVSSNFLYSNLAVGDKNVWWYRTTSNLVFMHIHIWALNTGFWVRLNRSISELSLGWRLHLPHACRLRHAYGEIWT